MRDLTYLPELPSPDGGSPPPFPECIPPLLYTLASTHILGVRCVLTSPSGRSHHHCSPAQTCRPKSSFSAEKSGMVQVYGICDILTLLFVYEISQAAMVC